MEQEEILGKEHPLAWRVLLHRPRNYALGIFTSNVTLAHRL